MESFFDNVMSKPFGLELMTDFEFEFNTKEREKPNENDLIKYITKNKKGIIDTIARLNPYEKILYLEKLKNDLIIFDDNNLVVIKFFLKLSTEQIISVFPKYIQSLDSQEVKKVMFLEKELWEKKTIILSIEELLILEKKYNTLRHSFNIVKNQLLSFVEKVESNEANELEGNRNNIPKISDYFQRLRNESFDVIDIYNKVESLTDNFKLEKLKILEKDINIYINKSREEVAYTYSDKEIDEAIEELKQNDLPIPLQKSINFITGEDGKVIRDENGKFVTEEYFDPENYDLEQLLFPMEFFQCYIFRNLIRKKISEQTPPQPPNIEAVEEKKVKTFIEYLSHPQREQLAESLRKEFEHDKVGKNFALMIKSLESRRILNLTIGSYSKLYVEIETYFNREIGTESGLNRLKTAFNNNFESYKKDFNSIDNRIEILLNDIEKEKNRL